MCNNFKKTIKAIGLRALAISFSMLVFSCGGDNNTQSGMPKRTAYYLEKVDSIRINRENTVTMLDFNPVNMRFLAYDQITQEFLILDARGQILEAMYRVGEGPNEYNSSLVAASFNQEKGGYYLLSSRDFLWFNEGWEVERRVRFASHVQVFFYTGPRFRVPYYTLPDIQEPLIFTSFFSGRDTGGNVKEGEISSKYLVELYHPENEELDWELPNDPLLLPSFELNKDNKEIKPVQVYALDNEAKLMYLTFERSDELGVYDLANGFGLKERISFEQESFAESDKAKNTALFKFGPKTFGVLYIKGLSEAATQARKAVDPQYFPHADPSLYRLIVVQDGFQQENEIEFPLSSEPHSEIIQLPDNRLLLRDKYMGEDEPEYSTYSVFELKPQ